MRILPNPAKEAANRRKHGLGFSWAAQIVADEGAIDHPDDRPLGYEHEGRRVGIGRIELRVFVLVIEPLGRARGEIGPKPISLRDATRREERLYWSAQG